MDSLNNDHYIEVPGLQSSDEEALFDSLIKRLYLREAVAEMVGTFLIVFAGAGCGIVSGDYGQISSSICGATAVVLMIFATAHISKAHLNPAVTLAFAAAGVCSWKQVVPYMAGQILGGLLASASLWLIVNDASLFSAGLNQPSQSGSSSFVLELVATFFLMFMNMKTACNLGKVGVLGGAFMVGITVGLLGIYAAPLGGGLSMNPARSIGPAVVAGNFKSLYIFVIAPTIGATLSGVTYSIICPSKDGGIQVKKEKR